MGSASPQHVAVENLAPGLFQLVVVRQENQDRSFVRIRHLCPPAHNLIDRSSVQLFTGYAIHA